jgi:putative transposase
MTSENVAEAESVEAAEPRLTKAVDDQLIDELVGRAQAEGLQLTGEGGLLQQLTKRLLESALEGEITGHLGYEKHDPAGKNGGNSRNGTRAKTVLTDVGPVEISVPRDRDGSFEPKIVKKRQKRLTGVDEMVISLSAKGLTTGEVQAHLAEVYGAEVSRQTISTITDKVMDSMAEWQSRPLDAVYPVVFIDAIHVKIRDGAVANRPIYVALAVTTDGRRGILGLWAGDGGEGAKHWLHILTEIKNRGVGDVLMLVCDGLKGLPDAVEAVWPQTIVQTCVVHLLRNSFRYAARQDWDKIARVLKPVYTAPTEEAALERFAEFADAWGSTARHGWRWSSRHVRHYWHRSRHYAHRGWHWANRNHYVRACTTAGVPAATGAFLYGWWAGEGAWVGAGIYGGTACGGAMWAHYWN